MPTDTPVPIASPVAEAGDDLLLVDFDGTGDEATRLDGSGSSDPEGGGLTYSWSADGVEYAIGAMPPLTVPTGTLTLTLTVTDAQGASATDAVVMVVPCHRRRTRPPTRPPTRRQ